MSKKWLIVLMYIILIAVVISVIGGILLYSSEYSNVFNVGSKQIQMPEGYVVKEVSAHGGIIKNDNTNISVYTSDKPTNESIANYIQKHENDDVINETENFDNIIVNKFILKDDNNKTKVIHLFFDEDNQPYHFIVIGDYDSSTVKTLINSLKG